jgi:agmatine deiminase
MPAEWEPHAATWLSWPDNPALWPGHFESVGPKFAEFASAISRFEPVCINCARSRQPLARRQLNEARADLSVITFHDHPTNDVWCRDHGPIFVRNDATGEVAVTDWQFRGWGGKFEAALDNAIPARIAAALGMRCFASSLELEGGGIEVNGVGQLLTTESVQHHSNRATGRDPETLSAALNDMLGVDEILWLGEGLAHDDTDGHIDNLARFYAPHGILAVVEREPARPNHRPLQANLARLRALRTPRGVPYEIVELPLPDPIRLAGRDLPPSHANFLIVNGGVLVPTYGQSGDAAALGILGELFPGREVLGIDCRVLLLEGGALHCLSQQQPLGG